MRRAYCVGRWEVPENPRAYPAASRERSEQDGLERVLMSRFFYRLGDSLPRVYEAQIRGWRGLLVEDVNHDGGCLIEEKLFYSDQISEDLVWLGRQDMDIYEKIEPLKWWFSKRQLRDIKLKTDRTTRRTFYYLEYEVTLKLVDDEMTFEITIPRDGMFKDGHAKPEGDNPIRQTCLFDCSADFKLINTVD
ncbi:hypothetical protein A1O3_04420 [Capronia epimyces CBS 606.96]|uniref:Uncharacterized protein n=1 Tax=Capronia epimyces CBS 606.96 TaxID=1182542 RepID=W9YCT1_9EURO|nr:uncharacterized protein A1O3_04420 [Capronia epimyces CBS 606.96]EXJ87460.1 hypothetical protein A1O3_04420 [Capronia epimyces CBS 606.96]